MRVLPVALLLLMLCASIWASENVPYFSESQVAVQVGDDVAWSDPAFDDSEWHTRRWSDIRARTETMWLRQTVILPPEYVESTRQSALFLTAAVASEVWWDGKLLGRNGVVGYSPTTETPGQYVAMFPLPLDAGSRNHVLAIRFSSQHTGSRILTPIDSLHIGALRDPLQFHQIYYLPSLILGGALAFAALFLLGMSVPTRSVETMLLGLAGIAFLAQLGLETSRAFVAYTYDWHIVRTTGIAIFAWLAGLALLAYLALRFREPHLWRWLLGCGGLGVVAAVLAVYPDPAIIAALVPLLVGGVIVSTRASLARKSGASLITAGLALILGLMFIDPARFLDLSLYLGFTALLLVFFVEHLRSYVRARQQKEEAALLSQRLRHELLKRSVQPHFLMNSLATLAEWVEESPRQGVEMIHALANELRLLTQFTDLDLVTLDDEIGLCQAHLRVMEFRQDQKYRLIVNGGTAGIFLPPAVLHTLVENALSHSRYNSCAVFKLTVQRKDDRIQLRFRCPPGVSRESRGFGTGTAYIQARLNESFASDWEMKSAATGEGGWQTVLKMPALKSIPEDRRPRLTLTAQPDT
jgi:hypothetical protein